MKDPKFKNYIYWGTTALVMVTCSVAFGFFLSRSEIALKTIGKIVSMLMPIIYRTVLAYLVLSTYSKTRVYTTEKLKRYIKDGYTVNSLAKTAGTLVSLLLLIAIIYGLFRTVIPQIYTSIIGLQESLGENVNNPSLWLMKMLEDNPTIEQTIMPFYEQAATKLQNWLATDLVSSMPKVIGELPTGLLSVVTAIENILIGIIVTVYLLNIEDTLSTQSKKIAYSLLKLKDADRLMNEMRFAHSVFGGFITGKLLDSLITGIMCSFAMQLLKMPYMLLVGVITGTANVVPPFGPFIGAAPSTFLILLVSPTKCLYFLIFILVLQQFDGNTLGPKILEDFTGLPSFRVLFPILLFGGLFRLVRIIITVPLLAVIYRLAATYMSSVLRKKDLSARTEDYLGLDYIDEGNKYYVDRERGR